MMPTVRDSDLAVTDPGHRRPLNDQLFGLWAGGGLVIKRLRGGGDHWQLVSDNPKYESQVAEEGDIVVGQVACTGPPSWLEPDAGGSPRASS